MFVTYNLTPISRDHSRVHSTPHLHRSAIHSRHRREHRPTTTRTRRHLATRYQPTNASQAKGYLIWAGAIGIAFAAITFLIVLLILISDPEISAIGETRDTSGVIFLLSFGYAVGALILGIVVGAVIKLIINASRRQPRPIAPQQTPTQYQHPQNRSF